MFHRILLLIICLLLTAAAPTHAQPSADTPLYTTGRAAYDRADYRTAAGDYRLAVQAHDRLEHWFGVHRDPVRAPDFSGPGLKMSGIRLASYVPPEVEEPDLLMRGGVRLAPNPSRKYPLDALVPFYLEVYDLASGENGQTRYQIDIAVTTESDRMEGKHVIWRLLARAEQALRPDEKQQTVTMTFEQVGAEPTQPWSSAIDTAEMGPGRYRLTVAVTDLITGDTVSQDRLFRIREEE